MARAVMDIMPSRYTLGDLKDASGRVLNKQTDPLTVGSTLEITIAGATREIDLPIIEQFKGAQTLHEMTPFSNSHSTGNITTLVIPVRWPDCPEEATDELLQTLRIKLGRVVDAGGNVTDHSGDGTEGFSLSQYYDAVSYGKYHIELLQAGGDNTFTDLKNLRPAVLPKDLFQAGDVFEAADYSEFLIDGRMDDGSEFGYTIKVVSIDKTEGNEAAVIRITRK